MITCDRQIQQRAVTERERGQNKLNMRCFDQKTKTPEVELKKFPTLFDGKKHNGNFLLWLSCRGHRVCKVKFRVIYHCGDCN